MLATSPAPAQPEVFGRWQPQPRRCALEQQGASPLSCHGFQLDQRNAEVVRLILQAEGAGRGEQVQLTLVGSLVEGSEPMRCRSGSCTLRKPMQVQLVSLSLARFDGRGLAQTLPSTWPVQGQCHVEPALLSCQASSRPLSRFESTASWSVNAELD
ncbi:MAG: hypothetical protein FJ056_06680 [Cyanobacteria bacterium M_surface_10_m2_179]|nr:hypothetical protein [Cyanobacteria bacterium M_surface_10_m2_179]